MNLARRFNAGIMRDKMEFVASATIESLNRRYAMTTQIHDLSRP
jgi:hypothetical protein